MSKRMSQEIWLLNNNIKVMGNRGNRIAIGNSNLVQNQLLLQAEPFGICIHYEYKKEICINCYSIGKMSLKCVECWASYCSQDCMDYAKSFHSMNECSHFYFLASGMANAESNPWDYTRLQLINIGLWILNFCHFCLYLQSTPEYQVLQKLVSNLESIPDHEHSQYAFLYDVYSQSSFKSLFSAVFYDLTYFKQIMSIRQCNGFGLWVDDELMGMALYPTASFFNHSCDPNIQRVSSLHPIGSCREFPIKDSSLRTFNAFYPRNIFKTLYNINENSPLYHSYIDTSLPYDKRQEILESVYHFTCECSKCIHERDQDVFISKYNQR